MNKEFFSKLNLFVKLATMTLLDAFNLLGVKPYATKDEVNKAFKNKVIEKHPDINKSPNAHMEMVAVNNAKEILDKYFEYHKDEAEEEAPTTQREPYTDFLDRDVEETASLKQNGQFISVKKLPLSIRNVLSKIEYNKHDIEVIISDTFLSTASYENRRPFIVKINLITGNYHIEYGDLNPTGKHQRFYKSYRVPNDAAILAGYERWGSRSPTIAKLYFSPQNSPFKDNEEKEIGLSEDAIKALDIFNTKKHPKEWLWGEHWVPAIEELLNLGFLKKNKAGSLQLTVAGKTLAPKCTEIVRNKPRI